MADTISTVIMSNLVKSKGHLHSPKASSNVMELNLDEREKRLIADIIGGQRAGNKKPCKGPRYTEKAGVYSLEEFISLNSQG